MTKRKKYPELRIAMMQHGVSNKMMCEILEISESEFSRIISGKRNGKKAAKVRESVQNYLNGLR